MAFTVGEYQDVFLEEADEQLQELNQNLLKLEKNHRNIDSINNIFRAAHSLKSSAAFVGLNELSDLAHNMENLLQGLRDRTMEVTPEIIDILFQCFDVINSIIESVSVGEEPRRDLKGIIKKIETAYENSKKIRKSDSDVSGEEKAQSVEEEKKEEDKQKVEKKEEDKKAYKSAYNQDEKRAIIAGLKSGKLCCEIDVYVEPSAQMRWVKVQLVINNLEQNSDVIKTIPPVDEIRDDWDDEFFKVVLLTDQTPEEIKKSCEIDQINRVDMRNISLSRKKDKLALKFSGKETIIHEISEEESVLREMKEIVEGEGVSLDEERFELNEDENKKEERKTAILKSVKVSVDKLDLLLNNVGELVIANSGFFKLFEEIKTAEIEKSVVNEFKNRMDQMARIAKDLQGGIMKTRMVPIGQVFSRFNRLVRDLAKEFNKKVKLEIKGEETELDKKVIDAIGEPLIHLIRNSIDHGIEPLEERKRLGKAEEATVTLNAYQGGNQIIVEVGDDGKGLDVNKIKKIAVDKGFTTPELLSNMDEEDIFNFIFSPGFSTADVITDISGRGVGMNVVREIISELSGSVRIETEPGMGTKFELTFPLTLAIIPAIMVKVSDEMYAIPLADVIETVKISCNDITTIEAREVVNLRGEILSLLRLDEFVGTESDLKDGKEKIPVVVVGYGNRKIGVVVDYLVGKQEIVIKSLEENYTSIDGLSGASILGDGNICLILDIASMINKVISDEEKFFKRRKSERLFVEPEMKETLGVSAGKKKQQEGKSDFISFDVDDTGTGELPVKSEEKKPLPEPSTKEKLPAPEPAPRGHKEKPAEPVIFDSSKKETPSSEIKEDIIFKKEEAPKKEGQGEPASPEELHDEKPSPGEIEAGGSGEDDDVTRKIKDTLADFRKELEENIRDVDEKDDYLMNTLNIEDGDMDRISMVMNVGIANAAESLSRIIDKEISISIPEVRVIPVKSIPESLGEIDTVYIGVHMPIIGDIKGSILFSLSDESGFQLIDMLYGPVDKKTSKLDEDGESALVEVTNIVGSSVINTISDKINLPVRPDVPTLIHDYIQSTIDSIIIENNITDEYALYMDTVFFYQDNSILGKMLILAETESLKKIIEKLRNA